MSARGNFRDRQAAGIRELSAAQDEIKRIKKTYFDGRSLRATGRTEQFNFKCRPDLKASFTAICSDDDITIAEAMEQLLEDYLDFRGYRS